jgi:aryl-alcohol dehydrogenase-like predicted oxidoreductase
VYARVIAALTMAASFAVGPAVLAAQPAAADEVAQAQNRVDRLQVLVRETTAQLLDGTEKWEQDRAALQQVQAQLVTVSAKVRQQEAVAAAGRARAGGVKRHFTERGQRVLDALHATATRLGSRPATVALAWLMAQPAVTSAIASATSTAQLDELLDAMDLRLDADALQQLGDASAG